MKVIKKHEPQNEYRSKVRFTCPVCSSLLEGYKTELQPVLLYGELHYGIICPACLGQVAVRESDLKVMRGAVTEDQDGQG